MVVDNTQDNLFSFYCGLIIRRLRHERGISGLKLAKKLNISQQQMSRYERGVNKLSVDMLFNILITFNVPFDCFFRLLMTEIKVGELNNALSLKEKILSLETQCFY